MRRVDCFMTRDGTCHASEKEARAFCEEMYETLISKLSHKLIATTFKYTAVREILHDPAFRETFEVAMGWKDDALLEKEED